MSLKERLPANSGLMMLALSLAIVFWLFVHYHNESETELLVPVKLENLASGLVVANQPPARINVRIAGPRIQMLRMDPDQLVVSLDLQNVGEGVVAFPDIDKAVPVARDLRITRVYPSVVEIRLVRKEKAK